MSEVTYHFNGHSASAWTDPDNFDDGSIATFASVSSDTDVHEFNSNTCPGTDLGTIIKVELRVHGKGDGNDQIELTPVFAGGDGDVHETVPVVDPGGWTAYVDITNDTNAPDWSSWSQVQALDCDAARDAVSKANTMYGSKVEIRVTYTPYVAPTVTTDAVFEICKTKARGIGNITDTGGQNCSKRGVCWNTTGNPTVADDKSEQTDSFGTGYYERAITGLTSPEHYYLKAYAYNSAGYGYSSEVEFDTWEPPVSDIDVGAGSCERANTIIGSQTLVDKNNPANASGIIHSVKVWAHDDITNFYVGTFYTTNGNTLKCRDSENLGTVLAGAERTFTELSIEVVAGDYIGCYWVSVADCIKYDDIDYDGVWSVVGEYIDPDDEATYDLNANWALSLYGYGDIVGVPANTVYLVKATGKRTQLSAGAVAIRIDPTTGRRSLDTSLTKFLVREDDGTLRAKSA